MRIQLACLCGTTLTGEATSSPPLLGEDIAKAIGRQWGLLHDGVGHGATTLSIARAIRRAHERGQMTTSLGTLPEAVADAGTGGTPGTADGPTAASSTTKRGARGAD